MRVFNPIHNNVDLPWGSLKWYNPYHSSYRMCREKGKSEKKRGVVQLKWGSVGQDLKIIAESRKK